MCIFSGFKNCEMKIAYIGILLFGMFGTSLVAQKYDIKTYSVNEGLPSGDVYDVGFSENGYAWFATSYGLVKSDGKTFTTFDKKNGFKDEIINDIFIDSKHNFWVATYGNGVGIFKRDTLIYPEYLDSLKEKNVNYIIEAPSNEIWFGTDQDGVYIWNESTKELKALASSSELQSDTIWDIYFDDEGNSWIANHEGLTVLDESRKVIFQLNEQTGLNGTIAYQVFEDSKGDKWIPSSNGVTVIKSDFSLKNISELNGIDLGYVYNISEDKFGRIWIGTERKGIFWYTPEKVTHITKENGLNSNYIYRLIQDNEDEIWVATEGNGVSIFKDSRFIIYDKDSNYGANEVYGVLKDSKGVLWFGNEKGLTKYLEGRFVNYKLPKGYENEEIWDIEELPNGNLLLLPYEKPLIQFDGKEFSKYPLNGLEEPHYSTDLFLNEDGNLLLAGEGGVIVANDGSIDTIKIEGSDYWASYVNIILEDKKGFFWFGTEAGVVQYDGNTQRRFNSNSGVEGSSINELKEDRLGNIWLGTNRGISILTKSFNRDSIISVGSFKIDERYLSETIFLQFDDQFGVWQGTNAGLNYYNLHSGESGLAKNVHFPLQEFGKGVEFNGSASLMDDEGNLWFGTAGKGIIKFDFIKKNSFPIASSPPKVFIRDMISNNISVIDEEVENGTTEIIPLKHNENNIEIKFSASNFKDPNRITYRYRLIGFDKEYQFVYDLNSIYYTNLNPGEYQFEVFAKSPDSEWSIKPAKIEFKIKYPFWLKWWFLLLIFVTLIFLTTFFIKVRLNHLEKKKLQNLVHIQTKDLKEALDEKEVLIKEIHHRVKNNLAVISGLLEMQSWSLENEDAKKALDESKLRVLAIAKIHENLYQNKNLGRIDFEVFLKELRNGIVSAMRLNRDIKVKIEVFSDLIGVDQAIPCGLIINELVTNSYKHAFKDDQEEKIITITFKEDTERFTLSVKDNGVGVDENILSSSKNSLGITLVKSLSSQLDAELNILNDSGALFEIKIPKKSPLNSST